MSCRRGRLETLGRGEYLEGCFKNIYFYVFEQKVCGREESWWKSDRIPQDSLIIIQGMRFSFIIITLHKYIILNQKKISAVITRLIAKVGGARHDRRFHHICFCRYPGGAAEFPAEAVVVLPR